MSRGIKTMIAIFICSMILQSMNTIALVISGAANTFPQTSSTSIQLIYTLITLMSVAGTLLAGVLAKILTKKILVILSSILMCFGGLLAYFTGNTLSMLYVASVFIGVGNGMLLPTCASLIAEHFDGGKRASILGLQSLFVSGGSILLNLLGGILAAHYWRNTYLIFLATLPVIIITLFLLPKGKLERAEPGEKVKPFNTYIVMLILQSLIFGICWMTFMANVTFYVYDLGIGNESQASFLTMAQAVGSVLIGLQLRKVMQKTGKYCFVSASLLTALSLWIFYFASGMPALILGSILLGMGFGLFIPSGYTLIPNNVHPAAVTLGIALFTAASSLGGFFNPYVITLGAGALNNSISTRFLVAAILQTANLLFGIITTKKMSSDQMVLH